MKLPLFTSLILALFIIQVKAQVQYPICKHGTSSKAIFNFEKSGPNNPNTYNYDVKYYRLRLEVDPNIKYIDGSVTCFFTPKDSNFNHIYFDLDTALQVDSVYFRNQKLSGFTHTNDQISIPLNDTIGIGQIDSIQIYYQGVPNTNGLGTFVQDSYNSQDKIIWTLSEPYGASSWWPCKNTLNDKADSIELIISTPIRNQVASNGLLLSIDTLGPLATYHWKSNYPIATYLIAFAVTNYNIHEYKMALNNDSILFQHFLYPGDVQSISQSLNTTYPFMVFFDSLLGTYPFINEKYGHASFTFGGGMEHQTMSFMGTYSGEVIAHELAHQWFGNFITCNSWQDLWLNEAFATYLTTLTYEFDILHNSNYLPYQLQGYRNVSFLYPHKSVFISDTSHADSIFTRIPYYKGASLLHMLRWQMGDSAFFTGVRNYLQDPALAYSFAKTNDLKQHLETSSGLNLTEFFKDWYYGKGYPTYTATWSQSAGMLNLNITQTQSDPSVYFFNMPIPYKLQGNGWDTIIVVNPSFSGQNFQIPISKTINQMVFDPLKWIGAKSTIFTGISEQQNLEAEIDIFPNPVNQVLQIKTSKNIKINSIELLNLDGKVIVQQTKSKSIDVTSFANGSYLVRLFTNHGILTKPIIISH